MEVLSVAAVAVTPVPGLTGCIRPHQPRPLPWPETRPRQGLAGAAMVVEMAAARPATPPSPPPPPPPPPFAATLAAALPHCYGATEKEKMSILSNGREGVRADASASEVYCATRTSPVSRRLGSRRQKGGAGTGWR